MLRLGSEVHFSLVGCFLWSQQSCLHLVASVVVSRAPLNLRPVPVWVRKAMVYSQCVELTFWSRGSLEGKWHYKGWSWLSLKKSVEENGEKTTQRNESNCATRICPTILCGLLVSSSLILIASLQNRTVTFTYKWPNSGSVIYILISAEIKALKEDFLPLRICYSFHIALFCVYTSKTLWEWEKWLILM